MKVSLQSCLTLDRHLTSLCVSDDGSLLATTAGRCCFVWSADRFRLLAQLNRHGTQIHRDDIEIVRLSPQCAQDHIVVTAGRDERLVVWDFARRARLHLVRRGEAHAKGAPITAMDFSADGQHLITAGADGQILCWSGWQSGGRLHHWRVASVHGLGAVRSLSLVDNRLATASSSGQASIYDTSALQSNNDSVVRLGCARPDAHWASQRDDGDATKHGWQDPHCHHTGALLSAALSSSLAFLVTASSDCTAKLWSVMSFRQDLKSVRAAEAAPQRTPTHIVGLAAASAKTNNDDEETPLSTAFEAKLRGTFRHEAPVTHVAFSPDERFCVSTSLDCTARFWHTDTNKQIFHVNLPAPPTSVQLVRDLLFVAVENRVLVFCIIQNQQAPHDDDDEPAQAVATESLFAAAVRDTDFRARVVAKGLFRADLRRGLAQGALAPQFLANIIMSSLGVDARQLAVNLAKFGVDWVSVLRLIADTTSFAHDDIVRALASPSTDEVRALFECIKAGQSVDSSLEALGFHKKPASEVGLAALVHLSEDDFDRCFVMVGLPAAVSSSVPSSPRRVRVGLTSPRRRRRREPAQSTTPLPPPPRNSATGVLRLPTVAQSPRQVASIQSKLRHRTDDRTQQFCTFVNTHAMPEFRLRPTVIPSIIKSKQRRLHMLRGQTGQLEPLHTHSAPQVLSPRGRKPQSQYQQPGSLANVDIDGSGLQQSRSPRTAHNRPPPQPARRNGLPPSPRRNAMQDRIPGLHVVWESTSIHGGITTPRGRHQSASLVVCQPILLQGSGDDGGNRNQTKQRITAGQATSVVAVAIDRLRGGLRSHRHNKR